MVIQYNMRALIDHADGSLSIEMNFLKSSWYSSQMTELNRIFFPELFGHFKCIQKYRISAIYFRIEPKLETTLNYSSLTIKYIFL